MKATGLAAQVTRQYMRLLESHPVKTKAITSGVIAGVGDAMCQCISSNNDSFNFERCAKFSLIGGLYVGPVLHVWYNTLGKLIPGISTKAVLSRLAADQLVFSPTFVPSFFAVLLTLEGKSTSEIVTKISNDWATTVQANWTVWIPAQYINFRMVPPSLQVLFANVVGLFWNSYLSYVSYK